MATRTTSYSQNLPPWLRSDHPGLRACVTLLSVLFVFVQVFGNLPSSEIRNQLRFGRQVADTLGLYERGWGMFAGTNTNTSTTRTEMVYADGTVTHVQYIFLKPGLILSPWNEVMQDLQFDDNNDTKGEYLSGFLRYTCNEYNTQPTNPLKSVAFQQQRIKIPTNKDVAATTVPFVTKKLQEC